MIREADSWQALTLNRLASLGINADANDANRLAIAAPSSLFGHDGDDHSVTVNKAAEADTASLLFQDSYSGRAEIGLTGSDVLKVKVSPDGTVWHPALTVSPDTRSVSFGEQAFRERLQADRTYYVRPDGDDTNDGLSDDATGSFASIQRAVDEVAVVDLGAYNTTIRIAPGTYADPVILRRYVGAGPVRIIGDTSAPGSVILDVAGDCIYGDGALDLPSIEGVCLNGSSRCIYMNNGAACDFSNVQFAGSGVHLYARAGGRISAGDSGQYEITATSCAQHAHANLPGSSIAVYASTVTLPASGLAVSTAFAQAKRAAAINFGACSFVNGGAATGRRFMVRDNAILITGAPEPFLPGDITGDVETGGILS